MQVSSDRGQDAGALLGSPPSSLGTIQHPGAASWAVPASALAFVSASGTLSLPGPPRFMPVVLWGNRGESLARSP